MVKIDYTLARNILQIQFLEAEKYFLNKNDPPFVAEISSDVEILFRSQTQAYREVMLGCILARIIDKSIDIRLPYINLGENAYNGRTLDEQVINPFLQEKHVPSSKGPFLSVFRRSVTFSEATKDGLRDKSGRE